MNFDISFERLMKLEFSGEKNALHWNSGEKDITFMGIYRYAQPNWCGWVEIDKYLKMYNLYNIKEAKLKKEVLQDLSVKFYRNSELKEQVKAFYKKEFWDKFWGDKIFNFDIANLIFIFGVNVGIKTAIKKAQEVVGTENDGIVGNITLKALNGFSPLKFVQEYKRLQIAYYTQLAKANSKYERFFQGWLNRVKNS